ncbi:MAG: peptidoglycan-binding protein, partial [Candidatus Pacebacteria bacterium]|nr:peptidoglycan-binding protein [Candidatus Paceibacterota bacterium]
MSKISKTLKVVSGVAFAFALVIGSSASAAITSQLKQGSRNSQVLELQQFLNNCSAETMVAASGAGSKGMETSYFGPATKRAVIAFQNKFGIATTSYSAGLVGPATRAKIAAGCGAGVIVTPPPVAGAVTVSLASDTAASTQIPDSANANFTKFVIASGSSSPVSISSLYVTRYGLSVNSDVENIKILDDNMTQVGSVGSLNGNNKAQITFSPALTIPAMSTKSFYIRAGIDDGVTGGKTVALGIASASDITANTTVGGSFPITGNMMGVVSLDIGTVTIDEDGTVTDSQPNGGDKDVVLNKFKLTAGSTEGVTVRQIAFERQGTASATDISNIELYDVSKSTTLGTMATWDANGMVTFNNLNIVLDKGETRRFEIRVDIIGGASLTVNADLTDGSDVYVQATGNTYGFYITPTNSMTNGQGASNQTIQSGSLTITKSSSTPATGNIAAGSDVHLATFDFLAQGEAMKVTSI